MFTLSVLAVFGAIGLFFLGLFKVIEQIAAGPQNNF
jgi:hypothetical protein